MKLLSKLTLLAIGVSVLPLAIAGYSSLHIGQSALRGALEENELTLAKQVAGYAESHIDNLVSILRVDARIFDLTRSTGDEAPSAQGLLKFLQLVYHQSDDFCAVAMFDEHGTLLGQPAYLEKPERYDAFKGHEPMRPTDVEGVGLMAPLGAALSSGQGMGPIFLGGPMRLPHVVLAVAFDPKLGGGRRILAAEVSLKRLANYVARLAAGDTDVALTDGRARLIAAASRGGVGTLATIKLPGTREGEPPTGPLVAEYVRDGRRLIGAYAPVPRLGLGALVDKTVDAAFLPVNRITWATLLWIGIAALIGSFAARLLAQRLSDRVAVLAAGARQIAGGNLNARIGRVVQRRAGRAGRHVQPDGRRPRGCAPEDHAADRRDRGVEPDAGKARERQDGRAAAGAGPAVSIAVALGAGRAGGGRRARDQQPADGRAGDRAAVAGRPARQPPDAAAAARPGDRGAAHPQDRAEHVAPGAAAERPRSAPQWTWVARWTTRWSCAAPATWRRAASRS